MNDEQRAELAKEHLNQASALIQRLIDAGAGELENAEENIVDVMSVLDDLEFEEGSLISDTPPAVAPIAYDEEEDGSNDDEEDLVEVFREDQEEV